MLVDLDGNLRWTSASDQRAQTLEDNQEIFAAGPYAQAYAALVGTLLAAAAKAELTGALAEQLQTALDSRGVIERAKGALLERERLDDQEAFTHLRRAARSSGRKLTEVPGEAAAGKPLPRGRTRPAPNQTEQPNGETDRPQPDA